MYLSKTNKSSKPIAKRKTFSVKQQQIVANLVSPHPEVRELTHQALDKDSAGHPSVIVAQQYYFTGNKTVC